MKRGDRCGKGAAARNLVLFVAGYATATAVTILILIVMLAVLPSPTFGTAPEWNLCRSGGVMNVVTRLARNALGTVLIALGFVLSLPLVPGQDVLTMLIGLMMADLPGKRRLELKLVAGPRVLETMNRVRAWLGRPPLVR